MQGRLVSCGSNVRRFALTVATSVRCFLQCVLSLRRRTKLPPLARSPIVNVRAGFCRQFWRRSPRLRVARCPGWMIRVCRSPVEATSPVGVRIAIETAAASRSSRAKPAQSKRAMPFGPKGEQATRTGAPISPYCRAGMWLQPKRVFAAIIVGHILRIRPDRVERSQRSELSYVCVDVAVQPHACTLLIEPPV